MADEPYRDKLFDHEYDGIREYDNPMPAWWVWMFVLSVLFAFPYVLWYHIGNGPSILDALEAEQAAYAEKLLATYGDLSVDEPTILRMMEDENAMLAMKGLFKGKCSQCHLADGSGSVGPNLTDDHWKNVKGVVDIAEVIRTGITTKGMPAWGDQFTETQLVLVSSYVAHLRNTPLDGKAPEGDPIPAWPDAPAASEATGDSEAVQ